MSGGMIFQHGDDRSDMLIDDDPIGQVVSIQIATGKRRVWRYTEVPYADLDDLIEALNRVRRQR